MEAGGARAGLSDRSKRRKFVAYSDAQPRNVGLGGTMRAIRIHETGGPEVLKFEEVDLPKPGAGEVRLRQHAVGINYIDVRYRNGFYPPPHLPFTPGNEGAGEVVQVGPSVKDFKLGDRVAYAGSIGSYAEERNIETRFLVKLPRGVSYETGAAIMLKGLSAQYLLRQTYRVKEGDIDARPCGGGRRRAHSLPVGQSARRDRDRHRRHRGQGQARQESRRPSRHRLSRRGFREAGRGDHQGREVPRGL